MLRTSADIIKEKRAYSWKTDKNGKVIDEPVKFNDHAQDAERYAIFTSTNRIGPRVRWLA